MEEKLNSLMQFLKQLGLENINNEEKKLLLDKLKSGVSLVQIEKELELLFALNKVLISTYKKVSINNMIKINSDIDNDLIFKLFMVFNEIKHKCKDEISCLKEFKEMTNNILNTNQKVNEIIEKDVNESFKKVEEMRNVLYFTMLDKDKADKLLSNCLKRSKLFLNQCDVSNLEKLIFCLKKDYLLSDNELVDISKRCATFFAFSSVSKLNNISKTLDNFKEYIFNQSKITNENIEIGKFLNRDFKNVLINSASVAVGSPDSIEKTIKFLMGEKIGDLKGNFKPIELAKIYNESITSLSINVEKIEDVYKNIALVYEECFKSKLDLNNLVNGHNFCSISQLNKEDYVFDGKIKSMFNLLNKFVSSEDIEKLLQSNFSFLIASISDVRKSLKSAVLVSQNKDELRKNVLQKIRNHFDMYDSYSYNKDANMNSSIKIGSLNKISIKDIEEGEIEKILEDLNVDVNDIDKWKKNWNKEEKDIRDLQIQIDLEDMSKDLDSIGEFLQDGFSNADEFVEETMICKNMLFEVVGKYSDLIVNKKINKKLFDLSEEVSSKIRNLEIKINNNISNVIMFYNEQLSDLNNNLSLFLDMSNKYDSFDERIKEMESVIAKQKLSYEQVKENKRKIEEMSVFGKRIRSKIIKMFADSDKANGLVSKFYDVLREQNMYKILNNIDISRSVDKYNSVDYLFILFVKILYDEGLIDYDCEIESVEDDESIKTYLEYKNRFLSEKTKMMTDEIYNIFKRNLELKDELLVSMLEYLDNLGENTNNIHTLEEAGALFDNYYYQKKQENNSQLFLFENLVELKKRKEEINIEEIIDNIENLESKILAASQKIKKLENNKIKR